MSQRPHQEQVTALMALVAFGEQNLAYTRDPVSTSIYDKKKPRVTNSSFTYISMDPTDKGFPDTYTFEFNKPTEDKSNVYFDLLGDCYISLEDDAELETVSFQVKNKEEEWKTLETLTAKTIGAFAAMYPRDYQRRYQVSSKYTVGLPFFFTRAPEDYMPMAKDVRFRITCKAPAKPVLTHKAVYLDTCERAEKVSLEKGYQKHFLFSTTTEYTVHGPTGDVNLGLGLLVKDMQVLVENESGQRVAVPNIRLKLNGHPHYDLDLTMATSVIPFKYYNIEHNTRLIHYLPFCHDPLHHDYTSSINFSQIDNAKLLLEGLDIRGPPYKVTVIARHYNTLQFSLSNGCYPVFT